MERQQVGSSSIDCYLHGGGDTDGVLPTVSRVSMRFPLAGKPRPGTCWACPTRLGCSTSRNDVDGDLFVYGLKSIWRPWLWPSSTRSSDGVPVFLVAALGREDRGRVDRDRFGKGADRTCRTRSWWSSPSSVPSASSPTASSDWANSSRPSSLGGSPAVSGHRSARRARAAFLRHCLYTGGVIYTVLGGMTRSFLRRFCNTRS